jgi:hypothetical protein
MDEPFPQYFRENTWKSLTPAQSVYFVLQETFFCVVDEEFLNSIRQIFAAVANAVHHHIPSSS